MTLEQTKQELVRRYKYLYENAYFILAPYMYEQSEEEFKKLIDEYSNEHNDIVRLLKKPLIYLDTYQLNNIAPLFEEFLLSDKPMEKSSLYQMIESKRDHKDYLDKVRKGLELLEKANADKHEMFQLKLNIWEIFKNVSRYIHEQSGDLKNKKKKLSVLDEYCRIYKYKNNGKTYTSGIEFNLHDASSIVVNDDERKPSRDKKDIGTKNNSFISTICSAPRYDNESIFTEDEKQQIYLQYHDELPWNLEITCKDEEECLDPMSETRLSRPENTEPCGQNFFIKEEEIFVYPDDHVHRYYQLCPHCGYIVPVPKKFLSEGMIQRIENRCKQDDKLFRKMFLYSELFSLDKKSTKGQKKLLKGKKQ